MYADHVPFLASEIKARASTFKRAIMFACLSARVQFPRVPDQMKDVTKRKEQSPALWSWKIDTYRYVEEHGEKLFAHIIAHGTMTAAALNTLMAIPGLGIVKGAFVLQMLGHDIACLDVRNIQREGLNPRAYRSDGMGRKSGAAFERKMARYIAQTQGRAAELWDRWCTEVAKDYGYSADQISWMHVDAIVTNARTKFDQFNGTDIPF